MIGADGTLLTATFSALADPTRRFLLEQLTKGEATVGELAEPLEMSLPAVSRHLKVLEEAGLLVRRRDGRRHLLTLNAAPLGDAREWLEHYRRLWEGSLDRLAEYLENGNQKPAEKTKNKKKKKRTKKKS